jgi:hypothetical protein
MIDIEGDNWLNRQNYSIAQNQGDRPSPITLPY